MTTNGNEAPLTEAELAEIEAATSEDCLGPYPLACPLEYGEIWGLVSDIPRLLADLRRAQKRIADLEEWCDGQAKDAQDYANGAGKAHDIDEACSKEGERDAFERVAAHLRGENGAT